MACAHLCVFFFGNVSRFQRTRLWRYSSISRSNAPFSGFNVFSTHLSSLSSKDGSPLKPPSCSNKEGVLCIMPHVLVFWHSTLSQNAQKWPKTEPSFDHVPFPRRLHIQHPQPRSMSAAQEYTRYCCIYQYSGLTHCTRHEEATRKRVIIVCHAGHAHRLLMKYR